MPFGLSLGKIAWIVGGAVAVLGLLGAIYLRIDANGYDRGANETTVKAIRVVAEQRKAVLQDADQHDGMSEDQIDAEWRRKCREDGGTEEQCK